jgi:O-antigen/teichoic acid export membrane protein
MLLCKLSLFGAFLSSAAVLLIKFDLLNRLTLTSAFYIYPLTMGIGSYLILQRILKYNLYSSMVALDSFLIQKSYMRLKSNFNLFFSQVVALIYGMSGAIFIGYLFSPEEAGKFSILEKMATPLISAGLLTHTAAFPRLIQIWLSDRKKYLEILLFCIKIYLLFALIVSLLYILFSDTINFYIYGNTENKLFFSLFLIWILIGFAGPIVTSYYSMIHKAYKVTQVNLITLILILCISIPLTIKLGALGWIVGLIIAHIPVLIILGNIIYTLFEGKFNR